MNRGDRREPIFRDDEDRDRFLATLGQGCFKTGWQVHAYCLMPILFISWLRRRQPIWWRASNGFWAFIRLVFRAAGGKVPSMNLVGRASSRARTLNTMPRMPGLAGTLAPPRSWPQCAREKLRRGYTDSLCRASNASVDAQGPLILIQRFGREKRAAADYLPLDLLRQKLRLFATRA